MTAHPTRRRLLAGLAALGPALALAPAARAHHGWRWTTGDLIELTGTVREARLGNPHGVVQMAVNDETWTVEVGQPWRNERAGLTDADFAPGTELTILGEPSADIADRRLKAVRVTVQGKAHDLYPERVS